MGHYRPRRPFIWQDEMTEVRELFRRVARVKHSGFTGFSVWGQQTPTAETLSKNRLRRRRAQFAVDLTHLNYKEPPFEALTHLHNIRGDIHREKEKGCGFGGESCIASSANDSDQSSQGETNPDFGRPHSAPIPDLGQPPLQYAPPKPKFLYDVTHRSTRTSRTSGASSDRPPVSRSNSRLYHCKSAGYSSPSPEDSNRSSPGLDKKMVSSELHNFSDQTYGESSPTSSYSEHPGARQGGSRPVIMAAQHIERPPSRMMHERPLSENRTERPLSRNLVDRLPLERLNVNRVGDLSSLMSSSNEEITSSERDSLSLARSIHGHSPRGPTTGVKRPPSGKSQEKPIFYVPPAAYDASSERALVPVLERPGSSPIKVFPNGEIIRQLSPRESGQRPLSSAGGRMHLMKVDEAELAPLKQRVKFASPSRRPETRKSNHDFHSKYLEESSQEDSWSQRIQEDLLIESERVDAQRAVSSSPLSSISRRGSPGEPFDEGIGTMEDSHVLIKHSSDPYLDFRNSMLGMIREEHLQDRHVEMEELFQYYLDLNPVVHHDVLKQVVADIRKDVLAGRL